MTGSESELSGANGPHGQRDLRGVKPDARLKLVAGYRSPLRPQTGHETPPARRRTGPADHAGVETALASEGYRCGGRPSASRRSSEQNVPDLCAQPGAVWCTHHRLSAAGPSEIEQEANEAHGTPVLVAPNCRHRARVAPDAVRPQAAESQFEDLRDASSCTTKPSLTHLPAPRVMTRLRIGEVWQEVVLKGGPYPQSVALPGLVAHQEVSSGTGRDPHHPP